MSNWKHCKRILCIRPDNIGDVIMSSPAIRALKETFGSEITLLTSSMAESITPHLPGIDDCIIYDVPWVKNTSEDTFDQYQTIVQEIKKRNFDAAVIFTVFSQNPLPTAMLSYHAGIPNRLAYCRENPYQLLTTWLPDEEPYSTMVHQVIRDLRLVNSVGAYAADDRLKLSFTRSEKVTDFLHRVESDTTGKWVILHPGVSEKKREYPFNHWVQLGKHITSSGSSVLITGAGSEQNLCAALSDAIGEHAYCAAGQFQMNEFIDLISRAKVVVSVNTATIHIAAAVKSPVVTLYALTNPQHAPWKSFGKIFPFSVDASFRSKNQILSYVNDKYFPGNIPMPEPSEVFEEVQRILHDKSLDRISELVTPFDVLATD